MTKLLLTLCFTFSAFAFNLSPDKKYIIKLKPGERTSIFSTNLLSTYNMRKVGEIKSLGLINVSGTSTDLGLKFYADHQNQIEYIEEDYPVRAFDAPNDPSYSSQKQLNKLAREAAWKISKGSKDVIVAVTDTGFNFDHPDLKNQVWTNPNEIPDNGIDDDENGYIDDVNGWNHADDNNNPMDKQSHGSHVAGIIGAEGNNEEGIVGMAWNVTIMPSQFLDEKGGGSTFKAIKSIVYASENGARIINASWGGGSKSKSLEEAIAAAQANGSIIIAAAGNEKRNNDLFSSYPANYPVSNIVSVAATNISSDLPSFSNYGLSTVHVGAPGHQVLSTVLGSDYKRFSGTSMAAPVVSGVAALMLSVNPDLTALQLRNGLMEAVDSKATLKGKVATGGEINPEKALTMLDDGFQVWPSNINVSAQIGFHFTTYGAGSDDSITWSVSDSAAASISADGELTLAANEPLNLTVTATNEATGESVTSTVVVNKTKEPSTGCTSEDLMASDGHRGSSALPPLMTYGLIFALYLLSSRIRRRRNS